MSYSPEGIIAAQELWVQRGRRDVLCGVSFALQRQETLVIIGQSGCGKTTLLKALIGLVPISRGELFILGERVNTFREADWNRLRLKIGYCFQEGALFDSLTVFDNVAFPLKMHRKASTKECRRKVMEKLELMGLPDTLHRLPNELSGGMRRRVGLARAIVMDPELILFDEPTTGLDPVRRNSIVELIFDLQSRLKVSAVVVTHDMGVADKLASRIGMLHEGKLLALTTPESIREHENPIVRDFVAGKLSAM